MGEAERAAPGMAAVTVLLNPVPAQRARLLLAQGDIAAAERWTHERGLSPDDEPGYPREPEYLVLARVLLAQHRPAEALRCWRGCTPRRRPNSRTGSVIEILALQALALGGQRRRPCRGGRPGRGAHPRLPRGLRPGLRRRRRADARPARPAGRAPSGPSTPPPAPSHSTTWPGCCRRSTSSTPSRAPGQPRQRCPV